MKLEERNQMKKKRPKFIRQDSSKKRVKSNWRKPRGIDSKMRLQLKGKRKIVKTGYSSPKEFKGANKKGLKEVNVSNVKDLKKIKKGMIALISKGVGAKKIIEILEEAKKQNIEIANYDESFSKKVQEKISKNREKKDKKAKKKAEQKKKKAENKKAEKKDTEEKKKQEKKEKDKVLTKKGAQ